eukprot:1161610-Pelagomonas_calceolata.AAC.1
MTHSTQHACEARGDTCNSPIHPHARTKAVLRYSAHLAVLLQPSEPHATPAFKQVLHPRAISLWPNCQPLPTQPPGGPPALSPPSLSTVTARRPSNETLPLQSAQPSYV